MNKYVVTSANYLMAALVSLSMIINSDLKLPRQENFSLFFKEAKFVFFNQQNLFSSKASTTWALLIGVIAGVFFFLAFIFYQKSVQEDGVGLAGTFSKLGILVPMIFSIILWQELPTNLQWLGILLALSAILLVNFPQDENWHQALRWTLISLFMFGGIAEFTNKFYQRYGQLSEKSIFLFFVFGTAFLISLYFAYKKSSHFKVEEVLTGALVGIPNLFSSYFLINALDQLKTAVVFPIYSAGSIVVISIGGVFIYNESLSSREKIAIVMTTVALVLINLRY